MRCQSRLFLEFDLNCTVTKMNSELTIVGAKARSNTIHSKCNLPKTPPGVQVAASKKTITSKAQFTKDSIAKGQDIILKRQQLCRAVAAAAAKAEAQQERINVVAAAVALERSKAWSPWSPHPPHSKHSPHTKVNANLLPPTTKPTSISPELQPLTKENNRRQIVVVLPSSGGGTSELEQMYNDSSMTESSNMLWKAHLQGSRQEPPCSPRGMLKPLSKEVLESLTVSPWENELFDDSDDRNRHLLLPSLGVDRK